MSGSQVFHAQGNGLLKENAKLKILVTDNAGVRGPAPGILGEEIIDYIIIQGLAHIQDIMPDAQLVRYPAGIIYGILAAAGRLPPPVVGEVKTHSYADNLIALFFQKGRGNRRIHPPAHCYDYTLFIHRKNKRPAKIIGPVFIL